MLDDPMLDDSVLDDHCARRRAREEILLRFKDLSWQDQYKTYNVIQGYFIHSGPGSEALRELRERAECVKAVVKAAEHLGMPEGEAPGVEGYERARKELGLELSAATIIRRWAVWREVCKAARGERVSQSARQRAHMRAAIKHRPHNSEEWLASVREWLLDGAYSPFSEDDYNAWAQERNETKQNVTPVATGVAIGEALVLPWSTIIKVAKREVPLAVAQRRQLKRLKKKSGEFVSTSIIALMLGVAEGNARYLAEAAKFPAVAFRVYGKRAWYLTDIEAYQAGQPCPKRKQSELQSQIMISKDVYELCGVTGVEAKKGLKRLGSLVPPSAGCIGACHYWLRASVEAWLDARRCVTPVLT